MTMTATTAGEPLEAPNRNRCSVSEAAPGAAPQAGRCKSSSLSCSAWLGLRAARLCGSRVGRRRRSQQTWTQEAPRSGVTGPAGKPAGHGQRNHAESEEKVAFVGFPLRPAVPAKAHLLGVVSTEFVTEKLTVRRTPRLHLAIHDWHRFSAKCAAGRQVLPGGVSPGKSFTHLLSLTPIKNPVLHARLHYQTSPPLTVPKLTHISTKLPQS